MGALAATYYGAAKFGFVLEFSGPVGAIVWLPAGVGIAFLAIGGLELWPGVLLGDLLANDYTTLPVGSALGQTVGNVLEVVLAAMLIRRTLRRDNPLGTVEDVCRTVGAIAIGTALSASIGGLSALLGGVTNSGDFFTVWRTWWLGDFIGALIVVPLALAWWRPLPSVKWRPRIVEWSLLVAALVVISEVALRSEDARTFLLFPVLVWAALRFGQRGATFAVALVSGLTVWNTIHYIGPFVYHSITQSVLTTQLFIAVAAISTLLLEAVVREREDLAAEVEASRSRIVAAGDRERRRLERNLHDGAQQRLVALAARLHGASQHVQSSPAEISALLVEAEEDVRVANDELRTLASGLHPAVLTDLGLAGALRSIAAGANVPVEIRGSELGRLDPTVEATAYYVVAEAVTNAQKHGRATSISISAVVANGRLLVDVGDNGRGGAVMRPDGGIEGLRDRVQALGGAFRLESLPGRGTSIAVSLPVAPPQLAPSGVPAFAR